MPPDDADTHRQTQALQNGRARNYGAISDDAEQPAEIEAPRSQSSVQRSSAPQCSPQPAAVSSDRDLLAAIFALTGPISLTTVVEFLPQILISAMVGHSHPATALRLEGHPPPSDHEGALLETYGLATLVYSTAAFSIVYGFICGLDSVASCSYGMTVDGISAENGSERSGGGGVSSTASTTCEGSSSGNSPCTIIRMQPMSTKPMPVESLRNQGAVRAAQWASPPLRGVGSPILTALGARRSGRRAGGAASKTGSKRTSGSSSHTHSLPSSGLATSSMHRSPSAPLIGDALDAEGPPPSGALVASNSAGARTVGVAPSSHPHPHHHHHAHPHAHPHHISLLHAGSYPPPDLSAGLMGPSGVHGYGVGVLGGLLGNGSWLEEAVVDEENCDAEGEQGDHGDELERGGGGGGSGESRALLPLKVSTDAGGRAGAGIGAGIVSATPSAGTTPVEQDQPRRDRDRARWPSSGGNRRSWDRSSLPCTPRSPDGTGEADADADTDAAVDMTQLELDGERLLPTYQLAPAAVAAASASSSAGQQQHRPCTVVRRLTPASPCPSASPSPSASPAPASASLIGTWIARCLFLEMFVVAALVVALHYGTEPLLVALGEPAESIPVAAAYVQAASFGLPFVAVYHSLNKGLQSSGVVLPVLLISVLAKALCLGGVWAALYLLEANLVAVAWVMSGAMAFQAAAVYAYMCRTGIAQQWWGRSGVELLSSPSAATEASDPSAAKAPRIFSWSGLADFCRLAFPACMAICLEFWLFDLLGALAGLLPDPATELATHYLLFTTSLGSYMTFSGISVAVSVLVGQKLGCAGQSRNARRSAIVGTSACLCVSALLMLLITLFHDWIARALTAQPSLLARFAECMPVLVAYQAVDGLNTCSTQLLRTLGVQSYGVLLHFTTYYLLGMSAAWTLAFPLGMGVKGLWIGLCFGVGLNAAIATVWLWRYADWEDQSAAAQSRANNMAGSQGDTPAAYLSSSDSFVGAREEGLGCRPPQPPGPPLLPLHADERTSLFTLKEGNAHAHTDHHGH